MKWATLAILVIVLCIAMTLGFTHQPIVGLISLVALAILGVFTLYKLTELGRDQPGRRRRRRRSVRRKRFY